MSPSNSVLGSLESIGFVQLVLLFAALIAYGLALSQALSSRVRGVAAAVALFAAIGFSAATPAWPDGIVLLALAIVAVAGFAGTAWLLARLLRLDAASSLGNSDAVPTPGKIVLGGADAALQPARAAASSP
ncbi:MAG: hypothetical protein ABI330_04020 [Caldimonas sp.]